MTDFNSFGLPSFLLQKLQSLGITKPTPIQASAIPLVLDGQDILASAETGSGKTFAFVLPILCQMLEDNKSMALVLAPTRELATQIHQAIVQLIGHSKQLKSALLIGGDSMAKQFAQLRQRPRFIIGTPGRVNDHLNRRSLHLQDIRYLVLDETDRMLDMGFSIQIDDILQFVPEERQTLLFSATLPANIIRLSNRYMRNPQRIAIGSTAKPPAKIKQEEIFTKSSEKFSHLLKQLEVREGSVIVFVRTKRGAELLASKLQDQDHNAEAMHGDLQQNKRDRVLRSFRSRRSRILVATDIASRGLDIPHIMHVINYDLPQCPEDYIHRIGRTARAGAEGNALCLISPEDSRLWQQIHRLMNPSAAKPRNPNQPPGKRRAFGQRRGEGSRHGSSNGNNASNNGSNGTNGGGQGDKNTKRRRSFGGGKPWSQNANGAGAPKRNRDFRGDRRPGGKPQGEATKA